MIYFLQTNLYNLEIELTQNGGFTHEYYSRI